MKITYRLNRRDIFFASAESLFHQPFLLIFLAIVFVTISYQNWQALPVNKTWLVKLITFVLMELVPVTLIILVVGIFLFATAMSRSNKTLMSDQTLILNENFLGCQSEYVRSEMKWEAVQRIVRTSNYLYLYVSQLGAILIPKRAFSSNAELNSFVEFCFAKSRPV